MKLYETINANNWFTLTRPETIKKDSLCLFLWLSEVYGHKSHEYTALHNAIRLLYPERVGEHGGCIQFNDHPETMVEDVIRVCKVADI